MNGLIEPKQSAINTKEATGDSLRPVRVLLPAIEKLGLPVFLFGVVFVLGTLLLRVLITPDRFPVRIGDRVVPVGELEQTEKTLMIRQAELQDTRAKLDQESRSPILHEVAKIRNDILPVGSVLLSVDQVRRSFGSDTTDPISLPGVEMSGGDGKIMISGEVRDLNGRSRDILTRFIDGLRAAGLTVSEPEYLQNTAPDGSSVSPFTISINLKNG
jgi:hypothetical protein